MADVEFAGRRARFGGRMVVIDGIRYKEADVDRAHKARLPQDPAQVITSLIAAPEAVTDDQGAPEPVVAQGVNLLLVPLDASADYGTIKQRVEDLGLQPPSQKKVDLLAALAAYYGGL